MPEPNPQLSELQSLWQAVLQWRDTYQVTCPEAICQMDVVSQSLPELAEAVLGVVGYVETNPLIARNPVNIQANSLENRITRLRNTLDYIRRGPPHGEAQDWARRALAEDDFLRRG
jgi:hypothetical protein